MATLTSTRHSTQATRPISSSGSSKPKPAGTKRKKDQPRTEIWSNLLRQTREAQARNRTQAIQSRSLIICGGSPADQRSFAERYLARPPPAQAISARNREQRERRPRGEVRLSNQYAYGYGHVTLFSPPQQSTGPSVGLLGGDAEEAAKVEVHCVPEAEIGYEETLRRLLRPKKDEEGNQDEDDANMLGFDAANPGNEGRRPAVCLLLSWKEPWVFLDRIRRWLSLLSRSLLPPEAAKDGSPIEVLQEHAIKLTVIVQHVEAQELLERENYKEESFDYISQCLRACLLPLSAALIYTPSSAPPQPAGSPLTDVQKVLYSSLELDIAALQPRVGVSGGGVKRDDLLNAKHNVVDRMAIVVPSGWDSVGKIRLLSETFSPEAVSEGWMTDLSITVFPIASSRQEEDDAEAHEVLRDDQQANGGAEVFETSNLPSPIVPSPTDERPLSPSKIPKSAIVSYENSIQDPNAHKAPKPPQIEVTPKPEQEFLAEMRAALQQYEQQDAERQRNNPSLVSTTAGALSGGRSSVGGAHDTGALSELGDVSFNVGGVSYNTVSAEAAIERLKRPAESPSLGTPRTSTPRPPRRDFGSSSEKSEPTPSTSGKDMPLDKLEEYFASLAKRGGGSGSSTPSKPPQ